MTAQDDLDTILAPGADLTIAGVRARVRRLRTREFFALMRIITKGLGTQVRSLDLGGNAEEQAGAMLGILLASIPEAEEEFVAFVRLVVEAQDQGDQATLNLALQNPELDDLIDVVTTLVEQEKDDLRSLVGKAQAALTRIQSVWQEGRTTG